MGSIDMNARNFEKISTYYLAMVDEEIDTPKKAINFDIHCQLKPNGWA